LRTATEQMLLSWEADAAWMYLPWEVLRAERMAARRAAAPCEGSTAAAKALRRFRLADYGVSFGYMNCITCTQETAERDGGRTVRALLDAVAEGAGIARSDPRRAAELDDVPGWIRTGGAAGCVLRVRRQLAHGRGRGRVPRRLSEGPRHGREIRCIGAARERRATLSSSPVHSRPAPAATPATAPRAGGPLRVAPCVGVAVDPVRQRRRRPSRVDVHDGQGSSGSHGGRGFSFHTHRPPPAAPGSAPPPAGIRTPCAPAAALPRVNPC
jgi:hypothetical protein